MKRSVDIPNYYLCLLLVSNNGALNQHFRLRFYPLT